VGQLAVIALLFVCIGGSVIPAALVHPQPPTLALGNQNLQNTALETLRLEPGGERELFIDNPLV
jgi:hypothetical protein